MLKYNVSHMREQIGRGQSSPRPDSAITEAIGSDHETQALIALVDTFDANQRQEFLAALDACERYLGLDSERLKGKEVFKALKPAGIGTAVAFVVLGIMMPPALAYVAHGGAVSATIGLLGARFDKRAVIGRLRQLRSAVLAAAANGHSPDHGIDQRNRQSSEDRYR